MSSKFLWLILRILGEQVQFRLIANFLFGLADKMSYGNMRYGYPRQGPSKMP